MKRIVVIRYGEIGVKGKNRPDFERQLQKNVQRALRGLSIDVQRRYGRLVGVFQNGATDTAVVTEHLKRVFGLENFSFGVMCKQSLQQITDATIQILENTLPWKTFALRARRTDKSFPINSMELQRKIGTACIKNFSNAQVDLDNPDQAVHIEVGNKEVFVTGNKQQGPGGLPVGVSGDVLCLLSGGIDSPVAAWYMMKRGCRVYFIHFHAIPHTSQAALEKVKELADTLQAWQGPTSFVSIPFADTQKQIITNIDPKYGTLVYRRFMLRAAERVAGQLQAKALITGESVGQVASQTIENIAAVSEAVEMPILRPLIGMNKQEIIDLAQQIGTYKTSIVPHDDCCTLFVSKRPETKARLHHIKKEEESIAVDNLTSHLARNAQID